MNGGIEQVDDLLIVNDNPADIRFIEEAFEQSPFHPAVHTTTTRNDALDFIRQRGDYEDAPIPDVIFLDWYLTRETGEEVLQMARSVTPAIPVVVMTSSEALMDTVERSISGVEACIEKPTDPETWVELFSSSLAEQ